MKQQSLLSLWGARKAPAGKENDKAAKQPRVEQSEPAPAAPLEEPTRQALEPAEEQAQPTPAIPIEPPAGAGGIDRSSGALARAADPVQRARAAAQAAQATVVLPENDGLSQYERERLGRIARNEAFMQSLGLGGGLAGAAPAPRRRAPRPRAPRAPAGPARRSPRLAGGPAPGDAGGTDGEEPASAPPPPTEPSAVAPYLAPAGAADVAGDGATTFDDERLKKTYALAASAGGLVAAAGQGGRVAVFCARAGAAPLASFKAHGGWVGGCAFVGNDRLLTAGNDGRVRLWDCASTSNATLTLVAEAQHARGIWRLVARDTTACTCAKDGCVVVWTVSSSALIESKRLEVTDQGSVRSVALTPQLVAAAADDGNVTGWDLRGGARAWTLDAHASGAQSCAFRPGDSLFVLTAGADRACKLWDLRRLTTPVRTFEQHHRADARRRAMHHPVWLSAYRFAVGGEGSERLAFYDADTGALTASLALGADATAVARVDDATVAVATEACDGVALQAVPA
jgi:hypothetical protein